MPQNYFAMIPLTVLLHPALSAEAKLLYGGLQLMTYTTDGVCYAKQVQVADEFSMPYRTFKLRMRELRLAGLVEIRHVGFRLMPATPEAHLPAKMIRWRQVSLGIAAQLAKGKILPFEGRGTAPQGAGDDTPILKQENRELKTGAGINASAQVANENEGYSHEVPQRIAGGEAMPDNPDWKVLASKAVDTAKGRETATRIAKIHRRAIACKNKKAVARDSELDAIPQAQWRVTHLATFFARHYAEAFREPLHFEQTFGAKGLGQLTKLLQWFYDRHAELPPEQQHEAAVGDVTALIMHVLGAWERLHGVLRLQGRATPGVLLAYRLVLDDDRLGKSILGATKAAARGAQNETASVDPMRGFKAMDTD